MSKRNGFVLYHDDLRVCDLLDDEQMGRMVRMLWAHSEGREAHPEGELMTAVFAFLAQKIDRDEDKYQRRVEKNREAANQRWNAEKGIEDDEDLSE